ncbi:MAG: hypothetical protein JEY94_16685 [Melioribacteraceae bacterium]|nr:hypothetical protein [Melioribacteraceae bacterium]
MKTNLCHSYIILVCFVYCLSDANAQLKLTNSEITFYAGLRSFYWEEYNDQGASIIEDEGFLFCPGVSATVFFSENIPFYIYTKGNIYLGTVDYSGFLQDTNGDVEDYNSETAYFGTEIMLNFGYLFKTADNFAIYPEAGFIYHYWSRDIDNGGQYGYDEEYQSVSINFGFNSKVIISENSDLNMRLLGTYPIVIMESIDLASRDQGGPADIELEPGADLGILGEIGINVYGIHAGFYFNLTNYLKSDEDQGYHQPESYREDIGINLGCTLKF